MSELAPHAVILLLVWGTVVALDLVSVPQAMLSRPLVVGTVAGWLVGDVEAGLRVGVVLELFALDVLPIGAVRYPDYGPATVAAVALAAGAPWELGLGLSVGLALLLAVLGGWSMQAVRRWNAHAIQHRAAALAAGESGAIRRLQYASLVRDAARAGGLTALGLACAWALAEPVAAMDRSTGLGLTLVALGCALSAAIGGAIRSAGRGPRLRWLGAGALVGLLAAALR
jgi:mannose/fructose/N-acetylgalactosamine-specific phosphotransferase system component IIC